MIYCYELDNKMELTLTVPAYYGRCLSSCASLVVYLSGNLFRSFQTWTYIKLLFQYISKTNNDIFKMLADKLKLLKNKRDFSK